LSRTEEHPPHDHHLRLLIYDRQPDHTQEPKDRTDTNNQPDTVPIGETADREGEEPADKCRSP